MWFYIILNVVLLCRWKGKKEVMKKSSNGNQYAEKEVDMFYIPQTYKWFNACSMPKTKCICACREGKFQ